MSPQKWIKSTNAMGMISKLGKYGGGTFARSDIAFEVEIHIKDDSYGVGKLSEDMNRAGSVVREARIAIENQLESPVVTKDNFEKITNKQKLN